MRRKCIRKELNILPPKPCIFCGDKSGSLEDIIARWILKTGEISGKRIVIGFGVWLNGKQDVVTEERAIEDMLLPSVCGSCNNTWMSQLENFTKSTLGELLRPQYPADDRPLISRLEKQKNLLGLWAMKTACTFGEKMSVAVPRDFVTDLRNLILPAGLKLELAYSEMSALVAHMTNHCRLLVSANRAEEMKNDASFVLALQINHLLIRLSYCPFTVPQQTNHRNPIEVFPSFFIPPGFRDSEGRPDSPSKGLCVSGLQSIPCRNCTSKNSGRGCPQGRREKNRSTLVGPAQHASKLLPLSAAVECCRAVLKLAPA